MASKKPAAGQSGERPAVRISGREWALRPIGEIVPYQRNAKIHSEAQIGRLRDSLRRFGFVRPLLIDEEGNLLAGHGTLEAAQAEGMEAVPCVVVSGLSEAERRAYILADNKLSELAEWDNELLTLELEALACEGIQPALLGFDLEGLGEADEALDLEEEPEVEREVKAHYHCPKCGFEFDA